MACPVCGFENGSRVCGRCGTDLDALRGLSGPPRLEIRDPGPPKAGRGAAPSLP